MSGLLKNPERLAHMRQSLFELRDEVVLSPEDYNTYWNYVSNVWVVSNEGPMTRAGSQSTWYKCRLWKTTQAKAQGGRGRKQAEEALLEAGGAAFGRQDVKNAGKEWSRLNPDDCFVHDHWKTEEQWADLADELEEKGYLTQQITTTRTDGKQSIRTVFAKPHQIDVLRLRGHITLLDSTHDTN
ncbi:MAG: 2,5-diamino-6-(ribosylamino)-4(3H)-pyrimidinone 5'-phosphate reductase [Candelina mexicana]|nr:MAG: 2,5-diamino-6-(ribosylamino)-4(3H)-pyrimidinone 5'-phosphate reductase [Candelina mexicana]